MSQRFAVLDSIVLLEGLKRKFVLKAISALWVQ